jgi:hypothetical protein
MRALRCLVIVAVCFTWSSSAAWAQRRRGEEQPAPAGPRKPVIEYMVACTLIALPVFLLCRSSRRMYGD